MMVRFFLFFLFFMAGAIAPAMAFSVKEDFHVQASIPVFSGIEIFLQDSQKTEVNSPLDALQLAENRRVVAILLNLTLGMLGVHRLYLGTKPWVPAVYLFTFGGGFFVLPFIDLIFLITHRDISRFEHNPRVLMWLPENFLNQEGN